MSQRIDYLTRRLRKSGQKTEEFYRAFSADHWDQQIYSEGASWTLKQILAHVAMAEDSMARLIANIVAGQAGVPDDFDLDAYNEYKASQVDKLSPAELLTKFNAWRLKTIEMVSQFDETDLDKQGRHPWLGITPVEEIIKLMYRHTQIHQREIRNTIKL